MPVIAIDVGTMQCKAAVFDAATMLAVRTGHYDYRTSAEGWADQDAEEVWRVVNLTVRAALRDVECRSGVSAICVSVHGDAVIPIDVHGNALHPAILGMDTRSHKEAAGLEERFGRGWLYANTGMPCEPLSSITKVCWLVKHRPELRRHVWKYLHYEEFLLMKIAGVPALDFSMASRTMAFDAERKDWIGSILDFAGVSASELGNLAPSGVPVGIIRNSVADAWRISRDTLIVMGGHNQCVAAVGAGVIEPELACYSMRAAEVLGCCFSKPRANPAMLASNYPCYCHVAGGQCFTITLNQSAGLSLDWFQEIVRGDLGTALEQLEVEPSRVVFLPHIVGSGTPTCDRLSRGSFLGLSLRTDRNDMFQAVADALAFEARTNLEALECLGIPVGELRAEGDGSRYQRLLEIKATVLGRPIRTLQNPEAALVGCAMLAQVAIGLFPDLETAREECVRLRTTVEPCAASMEAYSVAYGRFRQVYGTLRSFYHNWRVERAPALA